MHIEIDLTKKITEPTEKASEAKASEKPTKLEFEGFDLTESLKEKDKNKHYVDFLARYV